MCDNTIKVVGWEKRIDVIIAGAQKAGTTSLKNYLGQHPEVYTHQSTECSFFGNDAEFRNDYNSIFNKFFYNYRHEKILLAKYAHLYSHEEMIVRLRKHNPKVKIVLLLRNPVERAYSSYLMEKNSGWLKRPFNEIIVSIENNQKGIEDIMYHLFVDLGIYVKHIRVLMDYFPKENIWIYLMDDFKNNPIQIVNDIFKRIGLPVIDTLKIKRHNKAYRIRSNTLNNVINEFKNEDGFVKKRIKPLIPQDIYYYLSNIIINMNKKSIVPTSKIDLETISYLSNFFQPYNDELESLIGLSLSNWNKFVTNE